MRAAVKQQGKLSFEWLILLFILPVVVGFVALGIGRIWIAPPDIFSSLVTKLTGGEAVSAQNDMVLWNIRLPRILLDMLVGAGLSGAGCAYQSLFANPLATPDTLGVASGASFGAALGILMGMSLLGIQGTALLFGGAAVLLTWLAGAGKGKGLNTIVLSGIMIGSLFSALVSLVKYTADTESELPAITYWLMGSLDSANFGSLKLGAPPILIGLILLLALRWRLNLLPLSEDEARSSGVNIRALRGVVIVCATMMTASCVSMCGQVGWVGLLVPHICRMKFGNNHLSLLPASISLGAVFMIVVDTLARSVSAAEIPVSILTAIIGAPFFIILMRRSGGWSL